jgi:predicted enzyme related to lactoylglutathione lyase
MLQNAPMYAYLPASDLARARRFYEDQVGLKAKEETAGGVVYEFAGGTACFLYPTPNAGTSLASQAFWAVADVDREIEELKARGVQFESYDDMPGERSASGAVTAGGAKAAWFKDSEGNVLALVQSL